MRLFFILAAVIVHAVSAQLLSPPPAPHAHYGRRCATADPSAHQLRIQAAELSAVAAARPAVPTATARSAAQSASSQLPSPLFNVTIPLVLHVLTRQLINITLGVVSPEQAAAQMLVLNAAFAGQLTTAAGGPFDTGIRFELAETRVYDESTPGYDPEWFNSCSPTTGPDIAAALAVSPETHQNVFTCFPSNGLLGWTGAFPADVDETSPATSVFILLSTVPGGGAGPYGMGKTLVHELGHSLGLLHTFQGGCGQAGDDQTSHGDCVLDTPAEASPAFGTPQDRDTCPGPLVGQAPWWSADPVSSFMDYSDDVVMELFSAGQAARMQLNILAYKPSLCASQAATGYCESPPPPPPPPAPPPPSLSLFASL